MGASEYLAASDGNGEAVRAIVTTARGVGNMELITDSVTNWPNKFVATSGTLNPVSGVLEEGTITVFQGHLTGSIITIEEFAPGYTDIGHQVNESVMLKPSTHWADIVSANSGASITISATPPVLPDQGDLWGDTSGTQLNNIVSAVGSALFPIGAIYTATVATNPADLLGFGVWAAFGSGRTLVGKAASGTFATAGATGGAETHTLTEAQIPSHSHIQNVTANNGTGPYPRADYTGDGSYSSYNQGVPTQVAGGGQAHNNLQPYIVVYMWQRTG